MNTSIKIWKEMLDAGVPKIHVQDLVQKHLSGLRQLDDGVEGRDQAIQEVEEFEKELSKED